MAFTDRVRGSSWIDRIPAEYPALAACLVHEIEPFSDMSSGGCPPLSRSEYVPP